jgi:hypothetical protein
MLNPNCSQLPDLIFTKTLGNKYYCYSHLIGEEARAHDYEGYYCQKVVKLGINPSSMILDCVLCFVGLPHALFVSLGRIAHEGFYEEHQTI